MCVCLPESTAGAPLYAFSNTIHTPLHFVSISWPSPSSASPTRILNTTSTSPPNCTMFWTPFQPPPGPSNFHALPRQRPWRRHMRAVGRCQGKKYHHTTNDGLAGDICLWTARAMSFLAVDTPINIHRQRSRPTPTPRTTSETSFPSTGNSAHTTTMAETHRSSVPRPGAS